MIIFVYGTTAEAIKIAPVARRLEALGIPYQQWLTKQHTEALLAAMPELGLPEPDMVIADGNRGQPLRGARDVLPWLGEVRRWMSRNVRRLRRELPANAVLVVHGDTMTTVVGAWIARRLRRPSAHIEAGLRSGHWRHPFPEELDRRIVGRLATVHYTPTDDATRNLARRRNVVPTHGNTAIDAVLDRLDPGAGAGEYGIALLHRFEFISDRDLVARTLATFQAHARHPVRLFVDEFARAAIVGALPAVHDRIVVEPKVPHSEFIRILRDAAFVVTDSGGIQAEAALLGTPTLIHRKATEQLEGVGENLELSYWDMEVLGRFLDDFASRRRPLRPPAVSPSDVIVDDLIARGFTSDVEP